MAKKIIFNNGESNSELTVLECSEYRYNAIATVLKLTVSESDHSFSDIKKLKNNTGNIDYEVDGEIKSEYSGYAYCEGGLSCNYDDKNGIFTVEVSKVSDLETRVAALEETVEFILLGGEGE